MKTAQDVVNYLKSEIVRLENCERYYGEEIADLEFYIKEIEEKMEK